MGQVTTYCCDDCTAQLASDDFILGGTLVRVGAPVAHGERPATRREVAVPAGSYCKRCLRWRLDPAAKDRETERTDR